MFQAQSTYSSFSVNDIAVAEEFYIQKLGLVKDGERMGLKLKMPDGGSVYIYAKDNHQPATYTVLNFVVSNIDEAVDELTKLGVTFERYDNMPGAQDEKGIMRGISANQGPDIAWFKDQAGNILSVLQNE